jgi:hypothetical protein
MNAAMLRVVVSAAILSACPALAGTVRFVAVDGGGKLPGISIRTVKGQVKLSDLGPLKRTTAYQLPKGAMDLQLSAEGNPVPLTVSIGSATKSPLVIILADAVADIGFRAVVIDDDSKSFPAGTCRFLNSSNTPLTLRFGTRTETLAENGASMDLRPEGDARKLGVQLTKPDAPEAILYSAVWQNEPGIRKLVIIADGAHPKTTPVEVSVIPDQAAAGN